MHPQRPLSPVLLIGAGSGEATCGILYLASYLRRNGIEAYVRLWDTDETNGEITQSLEALLSRVKPKLVGISLKWFHHVHRALRMARTIRKIDRSIRIVVGGNSAAYWWRELSKFDCFDFVALGDGEQPLLSICRGDEKPLNCVVHDPDGSPRRIPLQYVQGAKNTDDVYYSHFNELFLSEMDLHAFSGWVAPGKGCGENCLYCGGARGNQKAAFGRAKPFLRAEENVRRDHQEIAPHTWQCRYDFAGSTAEFLQSTWAGVDLSKHCCTYFLWGVARAELVDALASTFERVYMVLDIGCFSESQRLEQMKRDLLKPCATNDQLEALISACRRHKNLDIEVSGIGGLPFASNKALEEELALVKRVIDLDCMVGYQRLEAQPGALATEHPDRFGMYSEAKSFKEFVDYFERRAPGDVSVPMLRFNDKKLEAAVQRNSDAVDELAWAYAARKRHVELTPRTRLVNTAPATHVFTLRDWFGEHKAPARVATEKVTVIRSVDGTPLVCAPTVHAKQFREKSLAQAEDGAALLAVLHAFRTPKTISQSVAELQKSINLDAQTTNEVVAHLVEGKFLEPARPGQSEPALSAER